MDAIKTDPQTPPESIVYKTIREDISIGSLFTKDEKFFMAGFVTIQKDTKISLVPKMMFEQRIQKKKATLTSSQFRRELEFQAFEKTKGQERACAAAVNSRRTGTNKQQSDKYFFRMFARNQHGDYMILDSDDDETPPKDQVLATCISK